MFASIVSENLGKKGIYGNRFVPTEMIELWMLFALLLPAPLLFAVGFLVGKRHVRYLAEHGGENGYPPLVRETARKYRRKMGDTE